MTVSRNPARDARILDLARSGLSASAIGREIGATRNAVIGVCLRHAAATGEQVLARGRSAPPVEANPIVAAVPGRDRRGGKRLFERKPGKVSVAPRVCIEKPKPSRFACLGDALGALAAHGCRWPLEDAAGVWFCGVSRHDGGAYCATHRAESVGKSTAGERRAAQLSHVAA